MPIARRNVHPSGYPQNWWLNVWITLCDGPRRQQLQGFLRTAQKLGSTEKRKFVTACGQGGGPGGPLSPSSGGSSVDSLCADVPSG